MGWQGRASRSTNQQQSTIPTGSRNIPEARARTSSPKLSKFLQEHHGNTYVERSKTKLHTPGRQQSQGRRNCQGTGRTAGCTSGSPAAHSERVRSLSPWPDTRGARQQQEQKPGRALTPAGGDSNNPPEGSAGSGAGAAAAQGRRTTPPRPGREGALRGGEGGVTAGPDGEKGQRRGRCRRRGPGTAAGRARPAARGSGGRRRAAPRGGRPRGAAGACTPAPPQRRSCGLGATRRAREEPARSRRGTLPARRGAYPAPAQGNPAAGASAVSPRPTRRRDSEPGPPHSPPSPRGSPWRLTSGSRSPPPPPPPSSPLSTAHSLPVPLRPPPF